MWSPGLTFPWQVEHRHIIYILQQVVISYFTCLLAAYIGKVLPQRVLNGHFSLNAGLQSFEVIQNDSSGNLLG